MKKKLFYPIATSILCLLFANLSFATPTFEIGTFNEIFFQNSEDIFRPDESGGFNTLDPLTGDTIQVGDIFAGIANVQNIDPQGSTTSWAQDPVNDADGIDQFTAYFAVEVAKIEQDFGGGSQDLIVYKATDNDPFGILDTTDNEVFQFYIDDSDSVYTISTSDLQTSVDSATDTDEYWSFSLDDPDTTASGSSIWSSTNSYWYSLAQIDFTDVTGNANALAYGGLYLNENPLGPPLETILNDPGEGLANNIVDLYFQSEIELGTGVWTFDSNDPAGVYPTPEPTTLLLFGTGLLGLAAFGRKKFMRKS